MRSGSRSMRGAWIPVVAASLMAAGPAPASNLPDWFNTVGIEEGTAAFPDEDLVELFRSRTIEVTGDGEYREEIRVVYHLRRGSADEQAIFRLGESARRRVKSMQGWVGRGGRPVRENDTMTRTSLFQSALYSDSRDVLLEVPQPSPGDLFGFRAVTETRLPGLRVLSYPGRSDVPVVRWECRLRLPERWKAGGYWAESAEEDPKEISAEIHNDGWLSWTRGPLVGPADAHPLGRPAEEECPAFFVRCRETGGPPALDTWPDIARWFEDLGRESLADTLGFAAFVRELAPPSLDAAARCARLGEWVRANVGYVQIYLRDGDYKPHPVQQVRVNRYGDCKDMAHLSVAMFRAAGFPAWPVLASLDDPGSIRPSLPAPGFNHCITALGRPDGSLQFFDPTAKSVPFGRLPTALEGAWALVVGGDRSGNLIRLPQSGPEENRVVYKAALRLQPDAAGGEIRESCTGGIAIALRERLRDLDPARRRDHLRETLAGSLPGVRITGLEVSDLTAVADTVSIRVSFESPLPGRRVGSLLLLQPDFLTWRNSTCLSDSIARETYLGVPARVETEVEITLPEGWSTEDLPDSIRVENAIGRYERCLRAEGGVLRLHRLFEYERARARVDEFPEVRAWEDAACRSDRKLVTIRIP